MWCIPKVDAEYVARMGGCARPLCRAARPEAAGGLLRRKPYPAHRRSAPADPGRTGDGSSASTTNIGATASSICSSFSMPIAPGVGSRSRLIAPLMTSPLHARARRCRLPRGRVHPRRPRQQLHPHRRRSLRRVPTGRTKRAACSGGLSSTTHLSTPAGSTWLRSRSACSKANARIAASKAATGSLPRSTPGSLSETKAALESTGCSLRPRREPKWRAPIPIPRSKSHNHCAGELAQMHCLVNMTMYCHIDRSRRVEQLL